MGNKNETNIVGYVLVGNTRLLSVWKRSQEESPVAIEVL